MRRLAVAFPAGLVLAVLLPAAPARAHFIVFKDGFTLTGTFKQEKTLIVDPGGAAVAVPKGYILLDDVVRRISFAHSQLDALEQGDEAREAETYRLETRLGRIANPPLPAWWEVTDTTDFNDRWERVLKMNSADGKIQVRQRITVLTTHYARLDAVQYSWTNYVLTAEIDPDVLAKLLYKHPDLKDRKDFGKRLRVHQFLARVGYFDRAEEELKAIRKDFPNEKDKIDEAAARLKKLRGAHKLEEVERGYKAGRHRRVQEQLAKFPADGADEKVQARVRALRSAYDTAEEAMALTAKLLKELPPKL